MYVTELLLNDWTDFNEFFYVCLSGYPSGLDKQWTR